MNLGMEKRERSSRLIPIIIVFCIFLVFFIIQVMGPILLPSGSINDLSGLSGVSDNDHEINNISSPWNSIYSIGDRLCHQKCDRSFFINENQMPFCARCTSIWLGILIGIGFMLFFRIPLDKRFLIIILIGLIPIGIDGFGQLLGFWESNNITRFVTGILIGFISGISIGIIIDEFSDIIILIKTKTK